MILTLGSHRMRHELRTTQAPRGSNDLVSRRDYEATRVLLQRLAADPVDRQALRAFFQRLSTSPQLLLTDQEVIENLAREVANHRLELTFVDIPAPVVPYRTADIESATDRPPAKVGPPIVVSLVKPRWLNDDAIITEALSGEKVTLAVNTINISDGTPIDFTVIRPRSNGGVDVMATLSGPAQKGVARCDWTAPLHIDHKRLAPPSAPDSKDDEDSRYLVPDYQFIARVSRPHRAESPSSPKLAVKGWIHTRIFDAKTGDYARNRDYLLFKFDGTESRGTTDDEGYLRVETLEYGRYVVILA